MNRHYPTYVGPGRVVLVVAAMLLGATGLVSLCYWLLPDREPAPATPAPATGDPGEGTVPAPGSVLCPRLSDLQERPDPPSVTSSELIDCPDLFDGRTVAYRGEVVGQVFPHGDGAVVTLNDDDYALGAGPLPDSRIALGGNAGIAVILPGQVARTIATVGDYDHRGSVVELHGRFESASEALGGEPAIVSTDAAVVDPGSRIEHGIEPRTVVSAVLAAAVAAALAVVRRRRH